jgi:hypothetical protein
MMASLNEHTAPLLAAGYSIWAFPPILYLSFAALLMIFLGVVLPAVWSRKTARRRAAADILQRLLDFLQGGRPVSKGRERSRSS